MTMPLGPATHNVRAAESRPFLLEDDETTTVIQNESTTTNQRNTKNSLYSAGLVAIACTRETRRSGALHVRGQGVVSLVWGSVQFVEAGARYGYPTPG